ncbi:2Fe-2S iron-sulfur cluster-binding protein [Nocardioides sp. Kera G14]|uniref:2Fe-2S iron-sulfur cluster-binding protein n=1 Tax=Nocardioides sp. Kera G14 TaxID=2884264 RepID=UPI001D10C848|nr:2Fe-2S iron-sulfur cluster-binding protein [Nocardioides sp. Kera G14]UDY22948.1 2Fe-2S iron-sulfur cluster-binding protein [Nocardioides sp. Kera G14]
METVISLTVDGIAREVTVDTRTTLLDALRERLGNTSPKKGCDHGQCGSCTVLVDGRRQLTCLALAVSYNGAELTTAAGLSAGGPDPHPMHRAFLDHDGYQCGYCTPGQVCSAVGMLDEVDRGHPSHATENLEEPVGLEGLTDTEIRERMSGNLCRCGAYVGILDAVREVAGA